MDFKFVFLIIVMSVSLGWPQSSIAQQFIDIDLAPPTKPKQPPPKQQPAQLPAKKPVQKPVAKPAAPARQVAPPKRPVTQSAPRQAAPVARKPLPTKVAPITKKPAPTPTATRIPVPTPAPLPSTPAPAPAQRPVTAPSIRPTPQPPPSKAETTSSADGQNSGDIIGDPTGRFKNRHGFTVDYTTWYETMKLTNLATKGLVEGNTHYFGISFNYDFTVYRERWGYALNVGAVTGNAQAGTKDSGDYYERRIVWTGFRGGGRLFWRANNRIDLGLGFLAQSKSTKWPEEENYVVVPQTNPHYFYYLDTRWRLNYRYELVQSFGTHLRSYALAWMLGLTYTLN
ncbi:MAG: hypothetical protein B7Y39_12785 [Bdellovibrio sp. 28-41-41]|nr:MAG: hypothetical protein B7Y39_12785 [Bdellovibrio sp. 28-41-41]